MQEQVWSEEKAQQFAMVYLLDQLSDGASIPIMLNADYSFLEPLIAEMLSRGLIEINDQHYQLADKGEEVLQRFALRYQEFINFYDIFCAVDLEKKEFAFTHYYDFTTDEEWASYLHEDRWEDIRLAVARIKGIDIYEMVFMSFISEDLFGADENGWQFDLMLGTIWDEIREICDKALRPEQICQEKLIELIRSGSQMLTQLLEEDRQMQEDESDEDYEVVIEEYQAYHDPYYLSPFWRIPLF